MQVVVRRKDRYATRAKPAEGPTSGVVSGRFDTRSVRSVPT